MKCRTRCLRTAASPAPPGHRRHQATALRDQPPGPGSPPAAGVLYYQRLLGNRSVARLLDGARPAVVQRDALSWLRELWTMMTLRNEIETRLKVVGPVNVRELVSLMKSASPEQRRQLYLHGDTRAMVMARLGGTESERIFSVLLSGVPYIPGWESELYQLMDSAHQDEVNQEVNRHFTAETGIMRKLKFENDDKPLVRRWLELRDEVVGGGVYGDIEEKRSREAAYDDYLREAVDKLKGVKFGSATEMRDVLDSRETSYDLRYWQTEVDAKMAGQHKDRERQGKLVNKDVSPSMAMHELFDHLDKWAFDCAEFVQVAHLYARWKTMRDEAFDAFAGGRVEIRIHYSTGIRPEVIYQRDAPHEKMKRIDSDGEFVDDAPIDELLDDAPIGSRVVWRNLEASASSDFYNENAVKLGDDEYAAHGFGEKNKFSRVDLERELAAVTYRAEHGGDAVPSPEYIRANVFVRTIEHYQKP